MADVQTRILTLNDGEHQNSTLYRIQKNWVLQFRLGPSLLGRKVSLYCNYPKQGSPFSRNQYQNLKWQRDEKCTSSDDTALKTELNITLCGGFHYYFVYDGNVDVKEQQGSGFFLVDPVLKYGRNEELPLDCIQCQTVLAKSLGSVDTWENKLRVGKESGYNMIHFTPIQKLGISNSSYSLCEQLEPNPVFNKLNGGKTTFLDIERVVKKLKTEWKVASICDIVLNHTANESKWVFEHPEVTYNCENCPYLRPAYLLDAALHHFSMDISKGFYEDKGIPVEVSTEEHLGSIQYYIHVDVLSKIKIHELYTCDVDKYVAEFFTRARCTTPTQRDFTKSAKDELVLVQDPLYRRLGSTVDMDLALKMFNTFRNDCYDEDSRIRRCGEDFRSKLCLLNEKITQEINNHLNSAVENCVKSIRYFRVQPDGPRIKVITLDDPVLFRYFTDFGSAKNAAESEVIMYGDKGKHLMAHNGWVMNADPLQNFAAPGSNIYLRRELIAWGDSVKLRYGDGPSDCPFLWNHMKNYVEETARIFDGVRLDNCHSTPIPVAEYLLDCARKVNPDLYVVAELFTNSDTVDNIFINRLGITSLIREAMSAWDSHEQGRLVYRFGGSPVGSFYQPNIRPLVPSVAHALFLDLTHDNPSPVEKRSVFDLLPTTAMVNMACCASGSNRGYDELVPHHIHVVGEKRQYTEWSETSIQVNSVKHVSKQSGIIAAKRALHDLHFYLGSNDFDQVYVDQMDPDIVAVTRHCSKTHESYILVAFTAFSHPNIGDDKYQRIIKPLQVEGVLKEIVLEATLSHSSADNCSGPKYEKPKSYSQDSDWINGLSEYKTDIRQHIQLENSQIFEKEDSGSPQMIKLKFKNFKPGSVAVIRVTLPENVGKAVEYFHKIIKGEENSALSSIVEKMNFADLNRALYKCSQEERDEGNNFDTYNIPNFGSTIYAGLQDYVWQRLKLDEGTKQLGEWIEDKTVKLKLIPRYLMPRYFDILLSRLYDILIQQSHNKMSGFIRNGSEFAKCLALGSIQLSGYVKSAGLPTLSPNLAPPKPPQGKNAQGKEVQACLTLSAGLPHFSTGYMRSWGRDTFIALRGLFLLTERYDDARFHILGYAACLRHGLIPNLLDNGFNSRYNCRDAVWWWLYCIKCYAIEAPNGMSILQDRVSRIFPTDDSPAQAPGVTDQPLCEVMQEALNIHFQGLSFRERNAGRQIDANMSDNGFNNNIGIHPETGFVFGGNPSNCGTWMDKMGSSEKARNRGKPATPRDGSAIELVGLCKSVVSWLDVVSQKGLYPYSGVERKSKAGVVIKWSFQAWSQKIQANFEKFFWVNVEPENDELTPKLINKRGIYKDCYGSSQPFTDFQLRCNFPITMVVAPELFNPQHAWIALQNAEKYLLGPLGMKTLDPDDWAYNGNYDNSNDSEDFNVAHGLNYHQGPEWVWPIGFYLRAKLHFAAANQQFAKTISSTKVILSKHFEELKTSEWRGLPELTNANGAYCRDSCRTQAWSMSCVLEVLHDLQQLEAGGTNQT